MHRIMWLTEINETILEAMPQLIIQYINAFVGRTAEETFEWDFISIFSIVASSMTVCINLLGLNREIYSQKL